MVGLVPSQAHGTADLVPLLPEDVSSLRLPALSPFTTRTLREHLARHSGLAWRTAEGGEYVVGGFWRQREDIGTVEDLAVRHHAVHLLERLLAAHRAAGARLVVLSTHESEMRPQIYMGEGFRIIDHILRMEHLNDCAPPVPNPAPALLRPCEEGDLESVLDVERQSFDWLWWNSLAELRTYARQASACIIVAELDGRVVGYSGCTVHDRDGHLDRLAVRRAAQGRGIGTQLLLDALRSMRAAGARWIALTTQVTNERAQSLYRRHGFVGTPIAMTIIGRWLGAPL